MAHRRNPQSSPRAQRPSALEVPLNAGLVTAILWRRTRAELAPPYPIFVSWLSEPDLELINFSGSGPYEAGEIETLWVIDIDGTLVVIST